MTDAQWKHVQSMHREFLMKHKERMAIASRCPVQAAGNRIHQCTRTDDLAESRLQEAI